MTKRATVVGAFWVAGLTMAVAPVLPHYGLGVPVDMSTFETLSFGSTASVGGVGTVVHVAETIQGHTLPVYRPMKCDELTLKVAVWPSDTSSGSWIIGAPQIVRSSS